MQYPLVVSPVQSVLRDNIIYQDKWIQSTLLKKTWLTCWLLSYQKWLVCWFVSFVFNHEIKYKVRHTHLKSLLNKRRKLTGIKCTFFCSCCGNYMKRKHLSEISIKPQNTNSKSLTWLLTVYGRGTMGL